MGKRARRWWIGLAALTFALALVASCFSFGPPDMAKAFEGRPEPQRRSYALGGGREIVAHETGLERGPLVLFVHGSPGAWNDFAYLMADEALASRARIVSVDRLGWGGSAGSGLVPSMQEQAAALRSVLEAHPNDRPAIAVGHSLGGPVAARLAMDAPELVDALVLVAGSIDPELEIPTWYQRAGRTIVVRALLPDILRRADDEIRPLRAELDAMLPLWSTLRMPVYVMQGDDDALVPPANADFAEREITHAPLVVERIADQGHLIPWERPHDLVELVLRALDAAK